MKTNKEILDQFKIESEEELEISFRKGSHDRDAYGNVCNLF